MENKGVSRELKKVAWGLFLVVFLQSGAISIVQNYVGYIYTDLAGVPYQVASVCMFVVTAIGMVNSIFAGATVQKTKTKWGQYRPWIAICMPVMLAGGLLMFVKTPSIILTTIIVSVGYLATQLILNYSAPSDYGVQMKIAGGSTEGRDLLASRYWSGSNLGLTIVGILLVPMIMFFGKNNETAGYAITHAILAGVAVLATIYYLRLTKKYDTPNLTSDTSDEEDISFLEMLKGVFGNRPGLILVLSDILRFTGFYVMIALMAYQCEYVIGDMMAMTYYLTATSFTAVLGNLLAPIVVEKMGGRKKVAFLFNALAGLSYMMVAFFGKTTWGFVIPNCIAYFFMSFQDTIDQVMYMDAGEYYLHKTGKDTRTFLLSMYGLAAKSGVAISTLALGLVLGIINYQPGMVLNEHSATMLTCATGLSPAICYLIPVVLLVIHGVSDKEMEKCIRENAQKYGA